MIKKSSPQLVLLTVLALLPLTADTAHAARRKLTASAPGVSQTTPRAFWSSLSKVYSTWAAAKAKDLAASSVAAVPAPQGSVKLKPLVNKPVAAPVAAPLLAAPPRRPLGPLLIIIFSPPKPVVSGN